MPTITQRITVPRFAARKIAQGTPPLVVVTAYDAPQGRLADVAGVDAILVGDSLSMTTLGYDSTLPVTLDDMVRHTRAVARGMEAYAERKPTPSDEARGARHALLIADMPFGTYGASVEEGVRAGMRLVAEGGAQCVKLEGAGAVVVETIRRLVAIGVPVMGHLGMTPQSQHRFGGFRVQGKTEEGETLLLQEGQILVEAGIFGMVVELVPAEVAQRLTTALPVPTIGIGAGPHCDGQVQVLHDLIGFTPGAVLRHTKRYAEAGQQITEALRRYTEDVRTGRFPNEENSF
jgi:3-methyl-2-oxobutanoate hydroxymethyltransferase